MHSPRREKRRHKGRGFSLVELIVTMALAAVLLAAAAPAFVSRVYNTRIQTRVNLLLTDVHLARIEAIKRNRDVVLCRSSDSHRCAKGTGPRTDWSMGWIVYVNADRDDQRDPGEPLLQARPPLPGGMRLTFNQWWRIVYRGDGGARNGTFTLCDLRGMAPPRALILYYTGRPRISNRKPDGEPLECG